MTFTVTVFFRESATPMVITFPTSAERDHAVNNIFNAMMTGNRAIVRRANVIIAVVQTGDVTGIVSG